jgi:hypothetical protein
MITQFMTQQIVDANKPAQTSPHRRFEAFKSRCPQADDIAGGFESGCDLIICRERTSEVYQQGCRFILGRKFSVNREIA